MPPVAPSPAPQPRVQSSPPPPPRTPASAPTQAPRTAAPQAAPARPQLNGASAPTNTGAAKPSGPGDPPARIPTGTRDYYKQRYDDFVRRNPGVKPPDYYLNYGDKYCQKFSNLTSKDLSPQGLQWRDRTLKNLQDAIEKKRAEDPEGFAQLERDPKAFKAFAYGTHPDAYIKGGLFNLPAQDLARIGTTPEMRDLLGKDGLKQVATVMSRMRPSDLAHISTASLHELERTTGVHMPSIHMPHVQMPNIHMPNIHMPQMPHIQMPHVHLPQIPRPHWPGRQ